MEGEGDGRVLMAVVGEKYCSESERELTVRKTCLFYPGDGFAAYDPHTGELVFRVDTYGRGPALADHLVLMDPSGASILTVRRKWPSLHQRWEGFVGDRKEGQKPLFSVRRSSIFHGDRRGVLVESGTATAAGGDHPPHIYRVEGSFAQRCCRVVLLDGEGSELEADDDDDVDGNIGDGTDHKEERKMMKNKKEKMANVSHVVAEIKRKVDSCSHVVLGKDVFCLCLAPGFDAAFAMGLILVLDQITSDDDNRQVDIDAAT